MHSLKFDAYMYGQYILTCGTLLAAYNKHVHIEPIVQNVYESTTHVALTGSRTKTTLVISDF